MISVSLILPLARGYARHAGLDDDRQALAARLRARLELAPWWARAYFGAGALFVRFAAPLLYLGRASTFAGLDEDEREKLLGLLQRDGRPAARAAFLGVKTMLAVTCYGPAGLAARGAGGTDGA
ncbi:MAG: hypothetical protein PHS14_14795 [Elusimicrobia bacterium]|nr:hypothetical protein [Elusimicrobiota bacterium]